MVGNPCSDIMDAAQVSNLRLNLPQALHHPLVCHRVSFLCCRGTAISNPLRLLASPAIISSGAVSVLAARDLCILSGRAIRVNWIGIECRQRLGSCAKLAACRWLREHLLLRAAQETKEE